MGKRPSDVPPPTPGVDGPPVAARGPGDLPRLARYVGFEPNDQQLSLRAALWAHLRQNPQIDRKSLTPTAIADMIAADCTALPAWWKEPGFSKWFLDGEEWRAKAELAFELTLDRIIAEAPAAALKDAINANKHLAEILDFMPKRWVKERVLDEDVGKKSPEELKKMIEDAARSMGWTPPKTLPEGK